MNVGKGKGNYFVCLEFSFHDSSYYTAFSLIPHAIVFCFVANNEGEYFIPKTTLPTGTREWFKKD